MLTLKQRGVLDFIVAFQQQNNVSPTFDEIATGLDLGAISTVHKHIGHLERKGYVRRTPKERRSIEVLPQANPHVRVMQRERQRILALIAGHAPPIPNVNELIQRISEGAVE